MSEYKYTIIGALVCLAVAVLLFIDLGCSTSSPC